MPVYNYECKKHGVFEISVPLRKWSDRKPCPKEGCGRIAEQVLLPSRGDGHFETPIIVHVSRDGSVRFPGVADARVPGGFEKRELRSVREVEQFERQVNQRLSSEAARHQEREEKHFAAIQEKNRAELRQAMQHFSPLGRDFAMAAIQMSNERKRKKSDVGFHSVILHNDSSREPWVDERTGWKRKYI